MLSAGGALSGSTVGLLAAVVFLGWALLHGSMLWVSLFVTAEEGATGHNP